MCMYQKLFYPRRHTSIWDSRVGLEVTSGSGLVVPENSDFGCPTVKGNSDFGSDQSPSLAQFLVQKTETPESQMNWVPCGWKSMPSETVFNEKKINLLAESSSFAGYVWFTAEIQR